MNEAYKEYVSEHPEELAGINTLKAYSNRILKERKKESKREINKVNKWRERLNGEEYSK